MLGLFSPVVSIMCLQSSKEPSAAAIKSGCHWSNNLSLCLKKLWVARASCLTLSTESFSIIFFQESSKPMMFPLYNLMILCQTSFSFSMKLSNSLFASLQLNKVVLSNMSNNLFVIKGNLLQNTSIMIEWRIATELNDGLQCTIVRTSNWGVILNHHTILPLRFLY